MRRIASYYKLNNSKYKYAIVLDRQAWPARSLRAKGYTLQRLLLDRPLTDVEVQEIEGCTRLLSYRYTSMYYLLRDEIRCNVPRHILRELISLV